MEFTFNASAVAAGGVIERADGSTFVIPSLAPVALSPSGGEGVTRLVDFTSEAISFSYAETRVFGRRVSSSSSRYTTETDVYISNLRVLDVLKIAMLRATVTSTREVNPVPRPGDDDHEFELDAAYHGVQVREPGSPRWIEAAPRIDLSMKSVKRYEHVRSLLSNTRAMNLVPCSPQHLVEAFEAPDQASLEQHLQETRPLLGALVDQVDGDFASTAEAVRAERHKLFIPGIGKVKFGELMLKPGRRRVNLIRFVFGPQQQQDAGPNNEAPEDDPQYSGGSLTVASVEGNGSPLWP